jgi:hypothetical protein
MKRIVVLLVLVASSASIAQQVPDLTVKKEAMKKLSMMVGKWKGNGWASAQDGSRNEFNQSEVIENKLDGLALLVEGLGTNKESGEARFNALAIITYNDVDSIYEFQSHLATGQSTEAKMYFEGEHIIWGFGTPGGKIRYTITITNNSKWNEYGEFSRDGNQWYKFIELNLEKVADN